MSNSSIEIPTPNQIHIWEIHLDKNVFEAQYLSNDERSRAKKFKKEIHRNRYINGRSALRSIFGAYLNVSPWSVTFSYSEFGKPSLNPIRDKPELHFNLAHSKANAVLAFSTTAPIGVDIETHRILSDEAELVKRFFSNHEQKEYFSLPLNLRTPAFYKAWTRKESILKATGQGLQTPLNSFSVSLDPRTQCKLLNFKDEKADTKQWTLLELHAPPNCTAALATKSIVSEISPQRRLNFKSN